MLPDLLRSPAADVLFEDAVSRLRHESAASGSGRSVGARSYAQLHGRASRSPDAPVPPKERSPDDAIDDAYAHFREAVAAAANGKELPEPLHNGSAPRRSRNGAAGGACSAGAGGPGRESTQLALQGSGGGWESERQALSSQLSSLLSASQRGSPYSAEADSLDRALAKDAPRGPAGPASGGGGKPSSAAAARRRRAFELASTEQRRLVEERAARSELKKQKQRAARELQEEQMHAAELQAELAAARAAERVRLELLVRELADAEGEARELIASGIVSQQVAAAATLASGKHDAEFSMQLELQEQLCRLRIESLQVAAEAWRDDRVVRLAMGSPANAYKQVF